MEPNSGLNPLLAPFRELHEAPPFDRIREEHFLPALHRLIGDAEAGIGKIVEDPDPAFFTNTILPLEQNGEKLGIVAGILFNLNHAETTEKLQQVAQEASRLLSEYSSRMLMNGPLFARIESCSEEGLSTEEATVLRNWKREFARNGARLDPEAKKRFADIRSRLSTLTLQFADHVLAETNSYQLHLTDPEELSGLPGFVREAAAMEAEARGLPGWIFTLHAPSFMPFMKYADRRELREQLYRAHGSRGNRDNENNNRELLREIVNLRLEKANLMGHPDYATYALEESMAGTPAKVMDFLEEIHRCSRPAALREFDEVEKSAAGDGADFRLEPWDWSYYAEKLRQKRYDFREEMLKPYFRLEKVTEGIFGLAGRLYGLAFRQREDIPLYHPDVKAYEVLDEDGGFLSLLYLDFFPRPGKQGGAWMTDFRGQSRMAGTQIRPQVSLVCNFSKPTATAPSLLTFDEVNTFLHEFGHALHGMLSQCTYPSVSGTNVYRDFVELPSQVMENWALEKEWLDLFADHFETGEKVPGELIAKLTASRNFLEGYAFERQLGFGYLDMAWHMIIRPFTEDPAEFEKSAMADTRLFEMTAGSSVSTGFSHIFSGGYAAGYYGYKWAEVLDADAFRLFSERGIFDRETAGRFRKNILERGGSENPMELYRRFSGREPDPRALLVRSGLVEGR